MSIYKILSADNSKDDDENFVCMDDGPGVGFQPVEEGDEFNEENQRIIDKYKQ